MSKNNNQKTRNDYFLQRGFVAEVRAGNGEGNEQESVIEGLAAIYEQESVIEDIFGKFTEVIRAGAFDDTDFDDVRLLVNHDPKGIALARSRRNNKSDKPNTMQLTVDEKGVNIRATLDTENNEQAKAVYSAIQRGDIDGMSFCFYVSKDNQKWSEQGDEIKREILKVDKVVEVSVVNFPAYSGTSINTRSLESDKKALENARELLENNRKQSTSIDYKTRTLIKMYQTQMKGTKKK